MHVNLPCQSDDIMDLFKECGMMMIIPRQTVALLMKFISTQHYHVAVDGLQMPQNMYTHTPCPILCLCVYMLQILLTTGGNLVGKLVVHVYMLQVVLSIGGSLYKDIICIANYYII